MDIMNTIAELSPMQKMKLMDYITDLPSNVAFAVKRASVENGFIQDALGRRTLRLSKLSTLYNYISGKYPVEESDGANSTIQREYCEIMDNIDAFAPDKHGELSYLMRIPCYDTEHFMMLESEIADLISRSTNYSRMTDMVNLICSSIVRYKLKALAFNMRLSIIMSDVTSASNEVSDVIDDNCAPILDTYDLIISKIRISDNSYPHIHNIAVLMYVYYKQLFVDIADAEARGFLKRFEIYANSHRKDFNQIADILHQLSMYKPSLTIHEALRKLYEPDQIKNLFHDNPTDKPDVSGGSITRRINNYIFFAKDIEKLDAHHIVNGDLFTVTLSKITPELIANAMRRLGHAKTTENSITYNISDDDIGHVIHACSASVGNVTDILNHTMRNIIYFNDNWYILFIDYMNRGSVFGISIPQDSVTDFYILEVSKDKSFRYKYVSMI